METTEEVISDILKHHGVKGMKWGVRKDRSASDGDHKTNDPALIRIDSSGAITLKKGARLQRVVRRANGITKTAGIGEDLGGAFSYASFSDRDSLNYELSLGRRQNFLNKTASDVITLTAKTDLRSPAPKEAARLYFETLRNDSVARSEVESSLREKSISFSKADVAKSIADPATQRSLDFYAYAFSRGNYAETASKANTAFFKSVQKAGYNMLLDQMDAGTGISDKPVILLNPQTTVEVTHKREVTRESLASARRKLKELDKTSRDSGKSSLISHGLIIDGGEMEIMDEIISDILKHHGIKGMKWGVRKDRRVGVSKSKGTEVPASDDAKRANSYHDRAHKHGPASLSNQEMQHLVSRLNLEQQYARLRPPTGKEKAAKFVADTLVNVGKQQVSRAVNDYASKQVGDFLKNKK